MGGTTTLEQELAKGAIFALSSRTEGFAMVLTEAMAHGLPVVSFDCPNGPAEIITPGQDGLLVPAADIGALATAIESLIADSALRKSLGMAARLSVGRYDMDHIRPQWEHLFTELLVARTAPHHS
jgi:glycosyltransferase involved in cell wall biosynthesis